MTLHYSLQELFNSHTRRNYKEVRYRLGPPTTKLLDQQKSWLVPNLHCRWRALRQRDFLNTDRQLESIKRHWWGRSILAEGVERVGWKFVCILGYN